MMRKTMMCLMLMLGMFSVSANANTLLSVDEIDQTGSYVTITGTGVRMRFGPGLNYGYYQNANGTARSPKKGTKLPLLGSSGDWYEVQFGQDVAYVFKQYAKVSRGTSAAAAPVRQTMIQVTGNGVRMRKGPGLNYDYLKWKDGSTRCPKKGEKLVYVDETEDWYKVKFANGEYYIFKQYGKVVK